MPDLQCAWLLLTFCGVPRANHLLRVLPPSISAPYARCHDDAIWECFCSLLRAHLSDDERARAVATLPARLGGLGLRSAERTAPAAYWAAWVDSAAVLAAKTPRIFEQFQRDVVATEPAAPCIQELHAAGDQLVREGFTDRPDWAQLGQTLEPPQLQGDGERDAGEWRHGWQYHASSAREQHFLEFHVRPSSSRAVRALLKSQSGPQAGAWLRAIPRERATTIRPGRMQVALRRRLRWPLLLSERHCEGRACRKELDIYGDHRAACMRSGRVLRRAKPLERTWARVFREAGGRVRENVFLRDMGVPGIGPADGRRIEVLATGLPLERGVPLAIDATMVSPLHGDGTAWAKADTVAGSSISRGEKKKPDTYPELVDSPHVKLLTLACEVGGRWSATCSRVVSELAAVRARQAPRALRAATSIAFASRWWALLSCCQQDSFAASVMDEGLAALDGCDAADPDLADVLTDACYL